MLEAKKVMELQQMRDHLENQAPSPHHHRTAALIMHEPYYYKIQTVNPITTPSPPQMAGEAAMVRSIADQNLTHAKGEKVDKSC